MATLLYNNRPARASFNSVLNEMLRDTLPAQNKPSESFNPAADVLESAEGFPAPSRAARRSQRGREALTFRTASSPSAGSAKRPEAAENAPKFRRVESGYGTFSRTFRLPDT